MGKATCEGFLSIGSLGGELRIKRVGMKFIDHERLISSISIAVCCIITFVSFPSRHMYV